MLKNGHWLFNMEVIGRLDEREFDGPDVKDEWEKVFRDKCNQYL